MFLVQAWSLTATAGQIYEGTDGDDTFIATNATYQTGDVIIGGKGDDTLNLTLTATNAGTATVVDVETVNVIWDAFGTATFDAANVAGAEIVGTSSKTGFLGNFTVNNTGSNDVTASTGMKGNLTVDEITSSTINATAATTVTANGAGADNVDEKATIIAGAATTTITTTDLEVVDVTAGAFTDFGALTIVGYEQGQDVVVFIDQLNVWSDVADFLTSGIEPNDGNAKIKFNNDPEVTTADQSLTINGAVKVGFGGDLSTLSTAVDFAVDTQQTVDLMGEQAYANSLVDNFIA